MAVAKSVGKLTTILTGQNYLKICRPAYSYCNGTIASTYFVNMQKPCELTLPVINKCHNFYFSTDVSTFTEQKEIESDLSPKLDKLYRSVEVECRGAEPAVLKSYHKFVLAAANHLEITVGSVEFPKYHAHRMTLLKSVFIHKKHRVQYEIRTHFLIMKFLRLTSSTSDTFLEYIQRNLPEGVSMKVTTEELYHLPPHVKPSEKVYNYEIHES